jgi:hypothetical protein
MNQAIVTRDMNQLIVTRDIHQFIVPSDIHQFIVTRDMNQAIITSDMNQAIVTRESTLLLTCWACTAASREREREFCIDNLLVRIHLIIGMILVYRPCAMGV